MNIVLVPLNAIFQRSDYIYQLSFQENYFKQIHCLLDTCIHSIQLYKLLVGWRAFLTSYNTHLSKKLIPEQFELIQELIDWLVPPIFEFLMTRCQHFVHVGEIHQFYVRDFQYNIVSSAIFYQNWLSITFILLIKLIYLIIAWV